MSARTFTSGSLLKGMDENQRAHHPPFGGGGRKGVSGAGYGKSRHIIIRVDRYPSYPISRPTGRKQKTNTDRRDEVMRLRAEGTSRSSKSWKNCVLRRKNRLLMTTVLIVPPLPIHSSLSIDLCIQFISHPGRIFRPFVFVRRSQQRNFLRVAYPALHGAWNGGHR